MDKELKDAFYRATSAMQPPEDIPEDNDSLIHIDSFCMRKLGGFMPALRIIGMFCGNNVRYHTYNIEFPYEGLIGRFISGIFEAFHKSHHGIRQQICLNYDDDYREVAWPEHACCAVITAFPDRRCTTNSVKVDIEFYLPNSGYVKFRIDSILCMGSTFEESLCNMILSTAQDEVEHTGIEIGDEVADRCSGKTFVITGLDGGTHMGRSTFSCLGGMRVFRDDVRRTGRAFTQIKEAELLASLPDEMTDAMHSREEYMRAFQAACALLYQVAPLSEISKVYGNATVENSEDIEKVIMNNLPPTVQDNMSSSPREHNIRLY